MALIFAIKTFFQLCQSTTYLTILTTSKKQMKALTVIKPRIPFEIKIPSSYGKKSAPRKERGLVLETLSKCVAKMTESFCRSHLTIRSFDNNHRHLDQL